MGSWEDYLANNEKQYIEELIDFLKIPSISSLSEHASDVATAADWVATRMERAGMDGVRVMPTGGHPVVYGEWLRASDKPTVMIYGHFDTQPADPLDLWTTPPFEPTIRDKRVYARGASDDKGNMLAAIIGVEALLKSQENLPVNIKMIFEGQEEILSPQLPDFINTQRDLLSCDLILSADGGQWDREQPNIILGLRGSCALQIDVQGANRDVHSGAYGGAIHNPIHALTEIVGSMHSPDGRILVKGFYDMVKQTVDEEKRLYEAIPYDESEFKNKLKLDDLHGEPGYSTYERLWVRPTVEVNGIWGGFQGEGTKTVIPNQAHAKISCRLVPDQDPEKILELVISHVEKNAPKGVKVTTQPYQSTADPYLIPHDHPGNQAAHTVHKVLYGKDPYYTRVGGSVPICAIFKKTLGVHTVIFGFGTSENNVHAPNEFFDLEDFALAQKAYAMILNELSDRIF